MAGQNVLLTGATGFLGMHVLKQLLDVNHNVRIVSRSEAKGEHLRSSFQSQASQISISVVPDQLAPDAYDAAAFGVDAIIHVASPFIMDAKDNKTELIDPAKKMTRNILQAAAKSQSVKRIVLTSSLAAVVNPFQGGLLREYTYTSADFNPVTEEQAEGPILGYLASKTLAEREAWDFVEATHWHFDLVTICPSLIVGPPLQEVKSLDSLNTSSANILRLFDVQKVEVSPFPFVVSVEDVALVHVRAMDIPEAGGKRFLTPGSFFSTQATVDAIREEYPELRARMTVGNPGKNEFDGTTVCNIDGSPAETLLGVKFRGWQDSIVRDTVPAILKLEKSFKG